jgi:hypothetical protein
LSEGSRPSNMARFGVVLPACALPDAS